MMEHTAEKVVLAESFGEVAKYIDDYSPPQATAISRERENLISRSSTLQYSTCKVPPKVIKHTEKKYGLFIRNHP